MNEDLQGPGGVEGPSARGLAAKREYVRDLVARADAQAVASLAECLCDESWYMRELAEQAFLEMGDAGATALLPLLAEGLWFTRTSAARALGRMAQRAAVPELFRLTEDSNNTAAEAARNALVQIGLHGGAVQLARVLHSFPPGTRQRRLEEITAQDRRLGERVERMLRNEELMANPRLDSLSDDSPAVKASEEGVEWEVLTGPPPPQRELGSAGGEGG